MQYYNLLWNPPTISGGGSNESPAFLSKIEMASCGHTARQCWHFQQPFQPYRSKAFISGYPSFAKESTMPEQVLMHLPHGIHLDLSSWKCVFCSTPMCYSFPELVHCKITPYLFVTHIHRLFNNLISPGFPLLFHRIISLTVTKQNKTPSNVIWGDFPFF